MKRSRILPLRPDELDDEQRAAVETFARARGVAPNGPFALMVHSPETMVRAAALGEHLRYRSAISGRLCELAILIIARRWAQDYEWHTHAPLARAAGVSDETIAAIADGRRPTGLSDAEQATFDFLDELDRNARVSDDTYARTLHAIGAAGIIDLCAVNGYYTLLAMTMNAVGVEAPQHLTRFPD